MSSAIKNNATEGRRRISNSGLRRLCSRSKSKGNNRAKWEQGTFDAEFHQYTLKLTAADSSIGCLLCTHGHQVSTL
jgi:hypothetical protein